MQRELDQQRERLFPGDIEIEQSCMTCPYLGDRDARLVYWLPPTICTPADLDRRLESGQRRHGELVYEPQCENCQECISLRVPISSFRPSRSQQRVWKRGQAEFVARVGRPVIDPQRIELLNQHSHWRGWTQYDGIVTAEFYYQAFLASRFNSYEISYYRHDQLVGIAICDLGEVGLSAVYTFYDPEFAKLSLGTYSVLYQLAWCRELALKYLYLGYYVADCQSLRYKANFLPHQRRIGHQWVDFTSRPTTHPTAEGN